MSEPLGIRERKKLRTREALIEAAADLCLRHGYDNTTVEQIAAAAEVSPRTFSRYFATKDAVITAMTGDIDDLLAAALAAQPSDICEFEALFRAYLHILRPELGYHTPAFRRMAVLIQITNNADSLQPAAFLRKSATEERAVFTVLGERLGVAFDHAAVSLISDVWAVMLANAFVGLGRPGLEPLEPGVLCDRMRAHYDLFRRTWQPWRLAPSSNGQPPTSAPDSQRLPFHRGVANGSSPSQADNRRRG